MNQNYKIQNHQNINPALKKVMEDKNENGKPDIFENVTDLPSLFSALKTAHRLYKEEKKKISPYFQQTHSQQGFTSSDGNGFRTFLFIFLLVGILIGIYFYFNPITQQELFSILIRKES
ncbi:hypothetical protein KAI58_01435 [Candidatus Gracilibacteria bacterium]|nr:hypothetical protein [Candidatus Gracilibacteria bacterium]